jgi:uncharacterized protein (TIGR03067 family)
VRPLILLAVAAVVGFAPAPFPRTERRGSDQNPSLVGKWDFTLWERGGSKSEASQYLEFTADKVHFVSKSGPGKVTYDMTTRPDLRPLAFQWKSSPTHGWVGSYRVEGDKLTLIFTTSTAIDERPKDFGGKYEYRFELRRRR